MPKKKSVKKKTSSKSNKDKSKNKSARKKVKKKLKAGVPKQKLTTGQKLADKLTEFAGSWTFIIGFFVFLFLWMGFNALAFVKHWDNYPFILLNLVLSCLAAIQAPVILMSQNRAAERDRHRAELDYFVNRKSEREVANMQRDLDEIKDMILYLHRDRKKMNARRRIK